MRGSRLWKNGWVACTALTVAIAGVAVSAASDRQKSPKDQPSMATKAPSQARPANRIAEKLAAMDAVGTPVAAPAQPQRPDELIRAFRELEAQGFPEKPSIALLEAMIETLKAGGADADAIQLYADKLDGVITASAYPAEPIGGVAGGTNEDCPQATALNCGDSVLNIDMTAGGGFTSQYGAATVGCTGFAATGPDVVYTITLGTSQVVTVDMADVNVFDASLYVVTDCSDLSTCVAGSDGCTPGCGGGEEQVSFIAAAATTYYIIADSFTASPGAGSNFDLLVSCAALPVCGNGVVEVGEECDDGNLSNGDGCDSTCQNEPPANDTCATADVVASVPYNDLDVPWGLANDDTQDVTCNSGTSTKFGIWYEYTPAVSCDLRINRSGAPAFPDTFAAIFTGACAGPLTQVACVDAETFTPAFAAVGGTTYRILVGQWSTSATPPTSLLDVNITCTVPGCGNGVVDGGETCDDGNTNNGDGCSSTCLVENETCGSAIVISSLPYSTTFNNDAATASAPAGSCNSSGTTTVQNDIWYSYTPATTCLAQLDVNPTTYDGIVVVHSGTCGTLTEVDCGDEPEPISLSWTATAGTTYYIQVGDWGASEGGGVTNIDLDCAAFGVCGDGIVGAGEECDDGNVANHDGCDSACQWEGACCKCAGACTANQSPAECATANGRYKGDQSTCTPGLCDTCGDSVIGPDEECDDGNATPGDGCDSCCQLEAPSNDDCTSALAVAVPGSSPVQSNVAANDDATGTCTVSSPNQGLWYTVVGNGNTITVSTCNAPTTDYDTMIQVWCDCPGVACVGGNDDQTGSDPLCETTGVVGTNRGSTVSFCSVLGHTYYVLVGGFSTSTGIHQLDATEDGVSCTPTVTCAPAVCGNGIIEAGEQCDDGNVNNGDGCDSLCQLEPATNDDCIDRITITDGATAFDNSTATTDGVAEASCNFPFGDDQIYNDLWYNYTATCTGLLVVDTCAGGSLDTRLAVYAGWTCPPAGAPLACDDDDNGDTNLCGGTLESVITLPVTLGDQLKIRVGEFSSTTTSGPDVLNVACTNPVCGNGTLEIGEQCDDGNVADGDGCSSTCQNEGACCDGSSCVVTTSSGCTGLGGVYQGDGVACGTQCSFGACCLPANAGCDGVSADCCAELGGTFQGGATCAGVNCPCDVTCDPGKTPENEADCGLPTDTVNGGCNSPSGGGASNCCIANGGLGCDDATCQAAVCAIDSFCCDTEWDSVCAGQALTSCPVLCPAPTFVDFGTIACGGGVCGSVQVDATAGQRDTDWYQATLAVDSAVTWTVTAEFPVLVAIVDSDAGALCADETYVVVASAVGTPCEEVVVSATLVAGTYEFLVLPSSFAVDIACGTQYTASLACSTPPATPTGACCGDPPAPGCSCTVQTEADCATAGGFYKGDGTVCGGNICDCNNNGACDQFDVVPVGGTVKPYPIDNPDLAVPDAGASPCGACPGGTVCIDVNGDGNIGPSPDRCGVEHTFNVPDSGTIYDVNVDFTFAPEHTFHADVIMIVSHNGVRVTLMDGLGLSTDLNGTYVLDDEAAVAMDAAPDADANGDIDLGTYRPDGLLSAFDGLNKLGDWTISVADDASTDTGTLASWSLEILNDATLVSQDCNGDSIPDSCQLAGNDCNSNSIPDDCELAGNDSLPPGGDGKPDDCNCAVDGDCPSGQTCNPCTNVCEGPAGFPCVTAIDCRNDAVNNNGCNCAQCISNVCVYNCVKFGNTNCAGPLNPNLDDILCVLAGFGNFNSCPNGDIAPCGGNNIINLDDILAVLNAFGGGNPCGCQNPPGTPPLCGGP